MRRGRAAVFLDRDGVLNQRAADHEYIESPEGFVWLPRVQEALAELANAGFLLIVVSNQRGLARGRITWSALRAIEATMQRELEPHGACIDAFYYCPHDLAEACDCRKPAPGLLLNAIREHGIDPRASVMIGDFETDVAAGRAAGVFTIRIQAEGDGPGPELEETQADLVADDLWAASGLVLAGAFRPEAAAASGS